MILRLKRITCKFCTFIDNILINIPFFTKSGLIVSDNLDHHPVFISLPIELNSQTNLDKNGLMIMVVRKNTIIWKAQIPCFWSLAVFSRICHAIICIIL